MSATTTLTQPPSTSAPSLNGRMKMDGTDPVYGDFRDDLARDGYAVVKGAIPIDRAMNYADRMYSLLESL